MTKNKNKSNLKGLKITNNVVRTEIKILGSIYFAALPPQAENPLLLTISMNFRSQDNNPTITPTLIL